MTRTKTQAAARPTKPARNHKQAPSVEAPEVLTLDETAAYLRVPVDEVLRMVATQGLPARQFGDEWRVLKSALQGWLGAPPQPRKKPFWETHFGALKDDPYLEEMLAEIYRKRGRPETEDG